MLLAASWTPQPPNIDPPPPLPPPAHPPPPPVSSGRTIEHNVQLTTRTRLSVLYRYPPGTSVEYPESGIEDPVGHLIPIDLNDWALPWRDFAYSRGAPDGGSGPDNPSYIPLLVAPDGRQVACRQRHVTCLGMKACPFADIDKLASQYNHTSATLADVQTRLAEDRNQRLAYSSPTYHVFTKTAAYINAIHSVGCRRPKQEPTPRTETEQKLFAQQKSDARRFQRGYQPPSDACDGRIIFHNVNDADEKQHKPYLSCEHYSHRTSPNHWADFTIAGGEYDLEYIAAVFTDDTEEISRIEMAAKRHQHGPLAVCTTLTNYSAQRSYCPLDHREDSQLVKKELCHLECRVKFQIWYPVMEERANCPYALVTSRGIHTHPVPLPEKTPQAVKSQILSLLVSLRQDLPDMTARCFLRHPAVKAFLYSHFPDIRHPTLSHLHPSLANRSHLSAYISQVKKDHFPHGTDWKGVAHLKRVQDEQLPKEEHYIRVMLELDDNTLPVHEEDDPPAAGEITTRIIICMAPDASQRLKTAGYIQSDIGFKRIVGFHEFEIASMDRDANTSLTFCRVYLNRQTAAAHQRIFQEIERLVQIDTGSKLRWRHLHANSSDDYANMVLHWGGDQHRGQAKGLGLHLVDVAATLPPDKIDPDEPHRTLRSLGPYDHLRRVFRLCKVHNYRNIETCAVPPSVQTMMRSLACVTHPNWDETIAKIIEQGGKPALDWVRDKESSQFAFAGICWEKSFIPLDIWKAGEPHTNLIEAAHRDVNREGVHCTLLGGLMRGQDYDAMKRATLEHYELHGIRPSYDSVHRETNAIRNLKRSGK
ncbi:hypothetical protein B0H19DRAFT_946802 [Mycena capillaripes]|nr:hypothetical protein B0H19DRAFT_946802 [Mycena capillaripes]